MTSFNGPEYFTSLVFVMCAYSIYGFVQILTWLCVNF